MKRFLFIPFVGIPYRHIYLLQLENYNLGRFWRLIAPSYFMVSPPRQELVWTPKLMMVAHGAFLLEVASAVFLGLYIGTTIPLAFFITVLVFLVFLEFHFFFLTLSVILFTPFDQLAKRRIIFSAREKLKEYPELKIVAVAGSYGKTTMKEVLATVLSEKYNVLKTPGNINTPVGIARVILQNLAPDTEVFVVELGEHYPGDLTYLTKLLLPDISIITGIGEAHLERFRNFENLIEGIFEVVAGAKEKGLIVLNADNSHIVEHYKKYLGGREVLFYNSHKSGRSFYEPQHVVFDQNGKGIFFGLQRATTELGQFSIPLLGEYAMGVSVAALIIGERLGLSTEEVREGLAKVTQIPHRLEVVPSANGVVVIDDSYNGNPEGARYAIETLGRFVGKRKIYITPGLVEAGVKTESVHAQIGRELAKHADVVVLIKNSVTPFIAQGLREGGFSEENIKWFSSAQETHAAIPSIIRTGDVVLFQNDWPDNYA